MFRSTRIETKITSTEPQAGQFRMLLIAALAALTGIIAGFAAFGLYSLIGFCTNLVFFQRLSATLPGLESNPVGLWVVLIPVIGGLIVGVMAKYGSPKIRGHGIPEAIEAILVQKSRISPRVAVFKPISAAVAIGTGGPFGAEGPIIQTGGALGSLFGQLIRTTAAERKVLLACGAAAGMAATFSTPIAGVVFAIELLLFEFKSRSFIPLVVASTLATTIHVLLIGPGPMFTVGAVNFNVESGIPFYVLVGALCGAAAAALSKALYWVEDQFERLPLDEMWWPAIGAVGLGIIGFFVPRVLGVGYGTITAILNAQLPLFILLLVLFAKSLALLVSLGSGTSGGLLAPTFMIGAALGGAFALVVNHLFPAAGLDPAAYALVGMAAVFAAAARATFTLIVFAFEITRNYNSVLPLMIVCVIANAVAIFLMKNSIMTEKLVRRGLKVHQEYEVDVLHEVTVGEVMDRNPTILNTTLPLKRLAERIAHYDPEVTRHQAHPLVNEAGDVTGIITRGDVMRAMESKPDDTLTVLEAGSGTPVVTYPDELLHVAVAKMLRHDIGRLPVVARDRPKKLVGYLGRAPVLKARLRRLNEESVRDPGWLQRRNRRKAS